MQLYAYKSKIYIRVRVKRYPQSKIGTVFQFGMAVQLQYCGNWQFGIYNAAYVHVYICLSILLCLNVASQ